MKKRRQLNSVRSFVRFHGNESRIESEVMGNLAEKR